MGQFGLWKRFNKRPKFRVQLLLYPRHFRSGLSDSVPHALQAGFQWVVQQKYRIAAPQTHFHCPAEIAVQNPCIPGHNFFQLADKGFFGNSSLVRFVPDRIQVIQRQPCDPRQMSGKCCLPGTGTADDNDLPHYRFHPRLCIKKSAAVIQAADFWRREWDSNPRRVAASLVFKTSSLNHSDISP